MIKRILVALSGTPYTRTAVHYALDLAQVHGAEVTGVTVSNLEKLSQVGPVPMGGGAAAIELAEYRQVITEERVEGAIADFERACRDAGVIQCVDREQGDPFELLTSLWRTHDLTILGLRGLFEYGVVHNPADQLLRLMGRGVRPLLAVAAEHRPIRRVLIAYKGSMASAKAMKRFCQMRLWPDVTFRVACFDRDPAEAADLLTDASHYCRLQGYEVEVDHPEGSLRDGLDEYVGAHGIDLVVMGAKARSRMARFVLGDTTLTAIRTSDVPLYLTS
ncbi:MAG: universal stress protein [Planctomycetota bacterium]|jgi:nucleotide-binding universal stress UspA family protein